MKRLIVIHVDLSPEATKKLRDGLVKVFGDEYSFLFLPKDSKVTVV